MGQAIIQPSRVRRTFNGWCHGLFAGQHFNHVLNLGCGHDSDRQGYFYSGYFDAEKVTRMDTTPKTSYPPEEVCLHGWDEYTNPVDVIGDAEYSMFDRDTFDMVFCNWMIYHCDHKKVLGEIHEILRPGGKLLVTYMDEVQFGKFYLAVREKFGIISYCYLKMDQELDGRDWVAEGIWGVNK